MAQREVLQRRFEGCESRGSRKVSLRDVDNLLALQDGRIAEDLAKIPDWKEAPTIGECFVGQWKAFLDLGVQACPVWREVRTINEPSPENVKIYSPNLPKIGPDVQAPPSITLPKENFVYAVGGRVDERCPTAGACAKVCTAGLPGFFIRATDTVVYGDPLWWLDPTYYTPDPSPYMTADFYHPMSFYRNLPGAIFGHPARVGESCSYWNGAYHMMGILKPYCIPGSVPASCPSSRCEDVADVPSSGTL
jgi:hypothetical protein